MCWLPEILRELLKEISNGIEAKKIKKLFEIVDISSCEIIAWEKQLT